ncbi:snRNA-activating protein complex subunit 1b isoform X2 [Phyllopteryx taeniolatus]|uniref:snRNA-activating protein complex subunit 1b isoform X2 n=1 Tax=Phyllopteryx taeniolatus TaxID=161469 RepID=UPI002AD4CB4F|nr:snRNA-activating protein complex subunit 1b isoform X2 [Phyllopteryx taeniolatus]
MNWSRQRNEHVRSDCEELLARFQQTDSVRFENFSRIWREMKFGQIFYGTAGREKRAFSRLVLDVAFVYFLPPFSFQIRVGGLYLIYGLYRCQTASPRVGLTFERRAKEARSQLGNKFVARASGPQELLDRDAMEELSNVHELYGRLKSSVYSPAQRERLGVDLTRENLPARLRGHVVGFHGWQKRERQEASDGDEGVSEGTSARAESSRRARLLSSIKSKAYGQAAEACKSRRHRQVEVDAGDSSGPAPPKGRSTSRRVSLKARTHENVRIAGEMWKEATTPTSINRLTAVDRGPEGIVIGGIGVTFSDAFSLSFQPKKKEDREDSVEQCFVSSSVDEGKGARRLRGRERSFMVQLWKTTAAAFLGLFSLPASFYDWKVFYVAQQYMTRLEFKILKIGRHSSEILCIII